MGMSTAWHAGNVPVPCLDDSAWFSCQNDRLREQAACSSQSLVCSFIPSFVRSCMIHSCCDELWWIQYEFNVQHLRHSEHFPTKPPGAAQKSREGDPQHRRDRCWGEVPGWRDRFQTKRSQKSLEKCGSKSIQIWDMQHSLDPEIMALCFRQLRQWHFPIDLRYVHMLNFTY